MTSNTCPLCNQNFSPADGVTAEEHLAQGILGVYAEIQCKSKNGNTIPYPRCGKYSMASNISKNALSLYYNVHICKACENSEAVLASKGEDMPLHSWWIIRSITHHK